MFVCVVLLICLIPEKNQPQCDGFYDHYFLLLRAVHCTTNLMIVLPMQVFDLKEYSKFKNCFMLLKFEAEAQER